MTADSVKLKWKQYAKGIQILERFYDGTGVVKLVDMHCKCLDINRKHKPGISMGKCRTYMNCK